MELLPAYATEIVIPVCAVIGIAFSFYLFLGSRNIDDGELIEMEDPELVKERCKQITGDVSEGVTAFLFMECLLVAVFMVGFAMLIFLLLGYVERFSTHSRPCDFAIAVSFLLGALTSAFSGFLGMKIALYASVWTGLMEQNGSFRAAFKNGAAMGFLLAAIGLLGLYIAIITLKLCYGNDWEGLFEAITGYGLGASSMAFFGRTGGGIYAKAADVCRHLAEEYLPNYQENRRPIVITYNVGDIVGDIAGIGTDLFGSFAESSCAALVAASISSFGIVSFTAMCYPLLISSMGILVCFVTTLVGKICPAIERNQHRRDQLIISTILMSGGIVSLNWIALPSLFRIDDFKSETDVKNWQLSLCVVVGLWAGQLLDYPINITPSVPYSVKILLKSLRDARGTGILASGFTVSCISITIHNDISISLSFVFAAIYGIALAALGMLSTIPTRLAIDASDPISHYANRMAQMARRQRHLRIDAPAATGKGFSIGSTALVSIALLGAFARRANVSIAFKDFQTLEIPIGLILGNSLPYVFSDMTMRSVGRAGLMMARAGLKMAREHQNERAKYIEFPTDEFWWGLIGPGALVMLTPVIVGTLFGADAVFGVLAGSLSAVLLIAVSPSDTEDGGLNKARKSIKDGALKYARNHLSETPNLLEAAVNRDTVGNPQKDTSGPPLNILVQLMALESLLFAPFFASHGGLLLKLL